MVENKGYDAGKKISGIKRHVTVDTQGLPHAILHTFKVISKRWVVERSFAWLEKCRRLWKNCERKLNTSLHMVILTFSVLLEKRL